MISTKIKVFFITNSMTGNLTLTSELPSPSISILWKSYLVYTFFWPTMCIEKLCNVLVVEEATVTTRPGPSGIKTKGAVAICFHIFGSSFLFINSHFTGLFLVVCLPAPTSMLAIATDVIVARSVCLLHFCSLDRYSFFWHFSGHV